MPSTRGLLTLVLVPLLAFLVACGGDDDDDGADTGGSGDQPAATETGGGGGASSSSDDDDDSEEGPSPEEVLTNCPELQSFVSAASSGSFGSPGSDVSEDIASLQAGLQEAADNAPDEISGDFQILADAFVAFFGTLDEFDVDLENPASFATLDAEAQAELQAALEEISSDEVVAASENIGTWLTENCS
jgi:hypothetical protein